MGCGLEADDGFTGTRIFQSFPSESFDHDGIIVRLDFRLELAVEFLLSLDLGFLDQDLAAHLLVGLDQGEVPDGDAKKRCHDQQQHDQARQPVPDAQIDLHAAQLTSIARPNQAQLNQTPFALAQSFQRRLIDPTVNIELINTGSELLLGRVLNSHQQWICRQLADRGHAVVRQVAVPDTAADIALAVHEALTRSQGVITTGGLGPTSDDLTRQEIARLLGRPLRSDPVVLGQIESFFAQRNRPMPASTAVQALVPEGATVLPNAYGTAPGLLIELDPNPYQSTGQPAWLAMLPGPPRELRPLFTTCLLPWLLARYPEAQRPAACTLRTVGIGESQVEQFIAAPLASLVEGGLELGYCARPGEVDIRLIARGPEGDSIVQRAQAIVRASLGDHIYGQEDDELDAVAIQMLRARHRTLAVAESCTGGFLAHRLTNVPGASKAFLGGFVTYSNESKQSCLGVRPETLDAHGAVSEETACEMARGALGRLRADYALAITGIAGPDGGTPEKPVGTAYVALATAQRTCAFRLLNPIERLTFKQVVTQQALELLRRTLLAESATS
jgi:nicotinamide-nucleotide amidase